MDIRLLRSFIAVAESGSVSAAAQRCGYSQPALSQQLGTLERHLDRRLFVRSPGGMRLTREGMAAYPYARVLVQLCDELQKGNSIAFGKQDMQECDRSLRKSRDAS